MNRAEFVEAVFRLVCQRIVKMDTFKAGGKMSKESLGAEGGKSTATAIDEFITMVLIPHAPADALEDPNDFRKAKVCLMPVCCIPQT